MIYFVRHGKSEANEKGVFVGQKEDSPLIDDGREQARVTAKSIQEQNLQIDEIITSPLLRAKETAEIIAREIGFDVSDISVDPRITEYDMGSLTGTPIQKISSAALIDAENAEDVRAFKARIVECIQEYSQSPENILIVSHAGVGRVLETIRQDMDVKLFYDLPPYTNASVTPIDWM